MIPNGFIEVTVVLDMSAIKTIINIEEIESYGEPDKEQSELPNNEILKHSRCIIRQKNKNTYFIRETVNEISSIIEANKNKTIADGLYKIADSIELKI